MARTCQECRACCSVMAVTEIAKPAYTGCSHECDKGCAIYEKRPESCAGYYCLWLFEGQPDLLGEAKALAKSEDEYREILRDEERPDKSGLIFEESGVNREESSFQKEAGFPFFTCREVRPGAFEGYWGQKILKRLTKKSLVILVYEDGRRRAIGPPEKVRLVDQF